MKEEKTISLVFTPPSIGSGKYKGRLCTINNSPLWFRYSITKIKNEFKDMIMEWYLPEYTEDAYSGAEITYRILRNNRKKIDGDALAFTYKWFQDVLTENGYILDDDKCRVILEPTKLGQKSEIETQVQVQITLKDNI